MSILHLYTSVMSCELSSADVGLVLVRRQVKSSVVYGRCASRLILSMPLSTNGSSYELDQEDLSCWRVRIRYIASEIYHLLEAKFKS